MYPSAVCRCWLPTRQSLRPSMQPSAPSPLPCSPPTACACARCAGRGLGSSRHTDQVPTCQPPRKPPSACACAAGVQPLLPLSAAQVGTEVHDGVRLEFAHKHGCHGSDSDGWQSGLDALSGGQRTMVCLTVVVAVGAAACAHAGCYATSMSAACVAASHLASSGRAPALHALHLCRTDMHTQACTCAAAAAGSDGRWWDLCHADG